MAALQFLKDWADPLVALGTLLLAVTTGWLAWRTHSMAAATREVAAQTQRLAEATVEMAKQTERAAAATEALLSIEQSRREGELTANVVPVKWDGNRGLIVKNIGGAPTVISEVWVGKPWRFRQFSMPIAVDETIDLGTQGWFQSSMADAGRPDEQNAPPGKTWARVTWGVGYRAQDGEWTLIDDG